VAPVASDRFARPGSRRTDYPDLGSQRLDRNTADVRAERRDCAPGPSRGLITHREQEESGNAAPIADSAPLGRHVYHCRERAQIIWFCVRGRETVAVRARIATTSRAAYPLRGEGADEPVVWEHGRCARSRSRPTRIWVPNPQARTSS